MAKNRIVKSSPERRSSGSGRTSKPRAANGPSKAKSRGMIAIGLVVFVSLAAIVIWRRSQGIVYVREIARLNNQITHLQSERARLAGTIRDESSRYRLLRVVEKQGMQLPNDKQVRIISR